MLVEVRVRFDLYWDQILWQNLNLEKMQFDVDLAPNRAFNILKYRLHKQKIRVFFKYLYFKMIPYEAEVVVQYFERWVDTFVR